MDGLTIRPGEGYLRTVADTRWEVKAVGDFNGDLRADIFWRHSESGENYYYLMDRNYLMDGTRIWVEGYLRTVPDPHWEVAGVGSFSGFFRNDIAWRHSQTGENYIWPMVGAGFGIAIGPTEGYVRTVPDPQWRIVAVGDYDGDGKSDLFWRHSATGENYLYPMDGTAIKPNEGYVRTVPMGSWNVAIP
jgi:hypothetical protein